MQNNSRPIVDTAVLVVAGMGTRFLPASKTIPKEMFPIVDTPLIHYAVKDALAAGVTNLIFITSRTKKALEDFYDEDPALRQELDLANKKELLSILDGIIPENVQISFVRQTQPKGAAHALWCARELLRYKPFLMLYPDDYIQTKQNSTCKQLVDQYQLFQKSIIGVQPVPLSQCHLYGVMQPRKEITGALMAIAGISEKPKDNPPSNLVAIGRYLVTPELFSEIIALQSSTEKEWPLMNAWTKLCEENKVLALTLEGDRFDCGSKLGYVKANIAAALADDKMAPALKDWLFEKIKA